MPLKTKIKNGMVILSVLAICCGSPLFADFQSEERADLSKPRIWTAVTGHQLKATYEGRVGNKIQLVVNGGKVKTILLEKLSEADQRLLNNLTREENRGGEAGFPDSGRNSKEHPFVRFLAEAKQKRLTSEAGIKYYQNVIDALFEQANSYHYKYPVDFVKEDNSFNMKYLKKMLQKRKSISMRTNLFTGEYLPTPLYSNEPQWKSVMQESFYKLDERYVNIEQQDTLYSDNDEKKVVFGVCVDRKGKNDSKYVAWYREDSKDYLYIVQTFVKRGEDGELLFGGIRGEVGRGDSWSRWHSYDARKGIFYSLFLCVDQEGKISVYNSEEGSLQFFASAPNKKSFCYPRKDCYNYYFDRDSKQFALGRYDLNGTPVSLERLWEKAGKQKSGSIGGKPTAKHDDPLNIFEERHIRDR
ncbi:hypothetical protein [uncultured Akkermansia sp.]|uniref:hypothetical protein n=3 Tax=uncultured Akkermansia sp. TaxID=512294 RepID=UPI00262058EE|nr:hypothetical protein [uncultured Akkermansia sp.]